MGETLSTATRASLVRLLRDASAQQAAQYFGGDAQALPEEGGIRPGQVLRRHMALVMLNSEDLRIVLKVHFDLDHMRTYRQAMGASGESLQDKRVIDYLKEFANQSGGRVCRSFDRVGTAMGMSVPLCTRGVFEIYADYTEQHGNTVRFGDIWRLTGNFGCLYCTAHFEVLTDTDYSRIECGDEAHEGEVEFL